MRNNISSKLIYAAVGEHAIYRVIHVSCIFHWKQVRFSEHIPKSYNILWLWHILKHDDCDLWKCQVHICKKTRRYKSTHTKTGVFDVDSRIRTSDNPMPIKTFLARQFFVLYNSVKFHGRSFSSFWDRGLGTTCQSPVRYECLKAQAG